MKFLRGLIFIVLIVTNIGCDQVSKSVVRENISYNEKIEIVNNNFILTKVENTGAFLGLGSSMNPIVKNLFLLGLPALILIGMLFFVLTRSKIEKTLLIGLAFIIGGGIGNVFDRMLYGSVTDFLHLDFGLFKTGIFNMADVSVMIGTFLIIIHSIISKKEEKNSQVFQ